MRIASCSCGNLCLTIAGEPKFTAACSCQNCQKRTGSVFGVVAYFLNDQIAEISGTASEYRHLSDAQKTVNRFFCAHCGSTVYLKAEFQPGLTGVAVGCFADPEFPEPEAAVWTETKHSWVDFPAHWRQSPNQEFKNR